MNAQIVHGGALDAARARHGGERHDWMDLSTGINPDSYPLPDLPAHLWQRLPDRGAEAALLEAARKAYGVPDHLEIAVGNGTQSLIELIPRIIPSERIAILSPTYQEHELSWLKAGRHVDRIGRNTPLPLLSNGLVAVNPNNPDGSVLTREELGEMAKKLALRHGWLIVDEAFCDSLPEASVIASMQPNMIVLRSFGKFFGLAGIRLGFMIATPEIINRVEHMLGPWAVSGPALEIGRRALSDMEWIENTRRQLPLKSERLVQVLRGAGFEIEGTNHLFVLGKHPSATQLHDGLCRRFILSRRFPDHPQLLRFGLCRDDDELQRLSVALGELTS